MTRSDAMVSALNADEWSGNEPSRPRARISRTTVLATVLAVPVMLFALLAALIVSIRVAVKAASMLIETRHARRFRRPRPPES